MQHSRSLLEIDQIESRAIQKRTACSTIAELCDMMEEMREKGESDKFFVIMKTALITDKKTQLIINNLKAIVQFEARLHFESYDTIFQIERKNLLKQTNKIDSEVDSNSQELAISYLPFWDTKIFGQGKKQEEDTKKVKDWFQLTAPESFNLCKRINCNTFREFINYFRMNQRLYSQAEVGCAQQIRELVKKGLDEQRIQQFTKLVTFLSAQWLAFPAEISSIISLKFVKIKLDLSQVPLNSPETLQAIVIAYYNCSNLMRRIDLS